MKKTVFCLAALAAGAVAMGATTCTWTGAGDGVSWGDPANWNVAPTSAAGDTLVIPAGTATRNTVTGLKIKALWFEGTEATTVSGEELEFSVAGTSGSYYNLSNECPLQIEMPIRVSKNFYGYYTANGIDYRQPVTVVGNVQFVFGKSNMGLALQGVANFHDAVTALEGTVGPGQGLNSSSGYKGIHFYGPVRAQLLKTYGNYNNDYILHSSENDIREAAVGFSHIVMATKNALGPNCVVKWCGSSTYIPENDSHSYYRLDGYDQVVDRVGYPSYPYRSTKEPPPTFDIRSSKNALLTMRATASDVCGAQFRDAISLSYEPVVPGLVLALTNRQHTMSGTITVSNGTLRAVANSTFANVPSVTVRRGGCFDLQTTASNAFDKLNRLTIEDGGSFIVGDAAVTPFGESLPQLLVLGNDTTVVLPAGQTVKVGQAISCGSYLDVGTYVAGAEDAPTWLKGGAFEVLDESADVELWKNACDGLWSEAARWRSGSVPDGAKPVAFKIMPGTYTATVDVASFANSLSVENVGASVTTLAVGTATPFSYEGSDLEVKIGGRLEVPEGAVFNVNTPKTHVADGEIVKVTDGGEFLVDGGLVDFTRGAGSEDKSDEGFRGTFLVTSADPTRLSRLRITSGLFKYLPYWGGSDGGTGSPVIIGRGGRLELSGTGVAEFRTSWWWNTPLVLDDGEVDVSDDAVLRCYGRTVDEATGNTYYFGRGKVTLRDRAVLTSSTNSSANAVGFPTRKSTDGWALEMNVVDAARIEIAGALLWHSLVPSGDRTARSVLTFDSAAVQTIGEGLNVGLNCGTGEIVQKRGVVRVGGNGLKLGGNDNDQGSSAVIDCQGIYRLRNGVLEVSGNDGHRSSPYGTLVGDGRITDVTDWQFKSLNERGLFEMTGGAYTNKSGAFIVGLGYGSGVLEQTGGELVAQGRNPAAIGFLGGSGTYRVANARSAFASDVYVGGAMTNHFSVKLSSITGKVGGQVRDLTTLHNATGVLEIGENGSFATDGNLVLSEDGTGTLSFVAGPSGVGTVTVGGKLVIGAGSKLTVDLGAFRPTERQNSCPLVRCAAVEGTFDAANVTFVKGDATQEFELVFTPQGIRARRPAGSLLIVR